MWHVLKIVDGTVYRTTVQQRRRHCRLALPLFAIYLSVARAAASCQHVASGNNGYGNDCSCSDTARIFTRRLMAPSNVQRATCTVHNLQRFNCICLRLMQLGVNQRQICADLQICLLHTTYIYKK